MSLKISTPEIEGRMQASKARKLPVLIDAEEMKDLFATLEPFEIYDVSRPVDLTSAKIAKEDFLKKYAEYVEGIKEGNLIDEGSLRPYFSSIFTSTEEILYAFPVANGKYLIKTSKPVIQLQRHHFIYSADDFHSGVMGEDSISWGIQFSYPQLFLDPKTQEIGKVEKNSSFPNTELFQQLAVWVRHHTLATPFIVEGKQVNVPMRLGKKCFSWINNHPGLKAQHFQIKDVLIKKNS